jgi:hypothetical protein
VVGFIIIAIYQARPRAATAAETRSFSAKSHTIITYKKNHDNSKFNTLYDIPTGTIGISVIKNTDRIHISAYILSVLVFFI